MVVHWTIAGDNRALRYAELENTRRGYIYAAGILFNLTVSLWWLFIPKHVDPLSEFLLVNLIAGSLAGILWLWLELRARQRSAGTEPNPELFIP